MQIPTQKIEHRTRVAGGNTLLLSILCLGLGLAGIFNASAQTSRTSEGRERLLMDAGWRFAPGHATDSSKDFDAAPAGTLFSYFAKAGTAAGAANPDFNDGSWREVNLPHDWTVELPFSERGSGSHGFKAIGKNFPENSVGWYRKKFTVPASDFGRRISIEFDGVFRDSQVWVNGFYLGRESSGYTSFNYNISDYLNYGGDNTIAVRVDASLEEGWFYEGAGIYRHVWLTKTAPLHVARWGTFVTTDVKNNAADVTARVTINNDQPKDATFDIQQTILDADGKTVASGELKSLSLKPGAMGEYSSVIAVNNPKLWSIESPYLHKLATTISSGGVVVDRYETTFGIRTLRWGANEGFFLNGQRVELKGTCDHQDHAGVGVAVPDEVNVFRVQQLKKMGSNAIRTSHNPPTPELLDACDRLGMLVMDEGREYGINPQQLNQLERLILRDRNHACVFLWSLGNEEWHIESSEKGTRITETMQTFAQRLDPTRRFTVAISGGWGRGSSVSIDVMGFNYFTHGNTDEYHRKFPDKPSVATEDASTFSTRGIYVEDRAHQHLTAYDTNKPDWGITAEESWTYYAARPYVAGLFQWTGFDYRGEPTPFGWPAINSQFGILDTCGFPKDNFYYYQSWWSDETVLHLLPHWNWSGREGQEIRVDALSNCEEVELFLNGKSLGRQTMPRNSHLTWNVKYAPGTLSAKGFNGGKVVAETKVETTGVAAAVQLTPHKPAINADGEDVAVITISVADAQGRAVPDAADNIHFELSGPGRILGVGNGDPSCLEPDQFISPASVRSRRVDGWLWKTIPDAKAASVPETAGQFDDANWQKADVRSEHGPLNENSSAVFRTRVNVTAKDLESQSVEIAFGIIDDDGYLFVNGQKAGESHNWQASPTFDVKRLLRPGENTIAVAVANVGGSGGVNNGVTLRFQETPAPADWQRSLFSGLAQVIVQSTGKPGNITLAARAKDLADGTLTIQAQPAVLRAAVP